MKLTRLRLIGFKSFVEPTDFQIEPGLTGVVGPNGCGKSNLVEALRWVMGESSHKAMRAAEMDDVIFSGNNNRPARNHAEVGILIDNTDRKAPAAFNDFEALEISRRIEREKGSIYRLNGREVRARDVGMVFADASTGSRSPALVHQGRIGEIIQAKPEQRRRVLEEAAGISGLHARRNEAELRLRAAEHNLQRVEDVINQIAAQVAALKTQARQAVRYRNISGQVRRTEAMLFHLRWLAANAEVSDTERTKDEAVRVVADRTVEQTHVATRQTEIAAGLPAVREAEARAAAVLQRLVIARETLDREEARAKERIGELDRRLVQFTADLERERRLVADAEAALGRLAAEEETLRAEVQASAARRTGADQRVAQADAVLSASEKAFGDLTGEFADLTARRHQLESTVNEQAQRAERLEAELANIEAGLTASGIGQPDVASLASAVETAQTALAEAEAAAHAAEAAHTAARGGLDATRSPLADAEQRAQRLDTEARTIRKLLAVENKNLWPPVMDTLGVQQGYEKALGAALGDDLDAPVDASAPMRWAGAAADPTDPALPEGATALSQYVEAPPELARRLAQIGVVDRADGARLRGAAKARPAPRLARRRPVALGRFCRRRPCADRRRAPARRARTAYRNRERACGGAQRGRSQASRGRGSGSAPGRGGHGRERRPHALARRAARR